MRIGGRVEPKPSDCRYSSDWLIQKYAITCSNWSSCRLKRNVFVGLYAGAPVEDLTVTHLPTRWPEPSRLRSCASVYSEAGTDVAESFWSVRPSLPDDWTGLTMKIRPTPVEEPLPGLTAWLGVVPPRTRPVTARDVAAQASTARDRRMSSSKGEWDRVKVLAIRPGGQTP